MLPTTRDWTTSEMVRMYFRVLRKPLEGTATDAIRCHSQACGLVAYVFDTHPDTVAHAVAEAQGL